MEQSYVAKLAWLVKLREVDITSKDWFQELYGKVEKTIYHLDLDISNLRGTKMNYKKRLEQAKLTCHQLRVLLAKRQGRPRDDANRPLRIYSPGPGEPWPPRLLSATRWKITEQSRSPQKKMVDGTSYPVESDPLSGLHRVVDNLATESARQQADVSHVPSSPVQSKIAFPKIFSRRLVSPPSARRKHLDEIVDRLRSPPEVVPKDPMPSSQSSSFCRDHVEVDVRTVTQIRQEAIQGTTSRSSAQRKGGNNRTVAGSLCKHNAPFWSEHAHLSESRVE
ncbi:hypothetical protein OESDEN_08419 [Oesophagostomum dentatum]|uniref:Uncharacterized protein n=1 Tax=Oesophagostomum dentatum TaxID=61180 RepID=A0A0B1T7E6_OESDE|nr:hypothetical protein OESDEN_08419 [Oesophagostomum dentatum]